MTPRFFEPLVCVHCDATAHVAPRYCPYSGNFLGYECDDCWEGEPGDSYYEDTGTNYHELQYASGAWGR